MTELELVKREQYDYLFLQLGYSHEAAKKFVDNIDRITGYFRNNRGIVAPSTVKMKDGTEVYLF